MIRSALLLCAGALVVVCSACAPAAAPSSVPVARWPLPPSCDATMFADAVRMLPDSFNPTGSDTDPPEGGTLDQDIHDGLLAAFAAAPPFLKPLLCQLNGVYVTPTLSWGYRNWHNSQRYVAIPAALWSVGAPPRRMPKIYSDYENDIVEGLLPNWGGLKYQRDLGGPSDSGTNTILAALAHEFGHVLWYDIYAKPRDIMHPENFCGGTFYTESWADLGDTPPLSRWRSFGLPSGTHMGDDVQIGEITNPPPGQRGKNVARIYRIKGTPPPRNGRWANLFAAFSPEEDFVETFKLFVLRRANTDLNHQLHLKAKIKINGTSITRDIPGTIAKRPVLKRKLACFDAIFR